MTDRKKLTEEDIGNVVRLEQQLKRELKDNNGLRVTVGEYFKLKQELNKLIEKESDLDLHPEAEDLKINLEINRILKVFKKILGDSTS